MLLQALLEQLSTFQQPDVVSFHSMAMAMELDQRHSVINRQGAEWRMDLVKLARDLTRVFHPKR